MSLLPENLSPCQYEALQLLEGSDNVFLTGCAGSGKSYLIRQFLKSLPAKIFPVLASTGAAAVLVHGRTFHSFFGLGILEGGLEATVQRACEDRRVKKRLREINGFILDEVSMIPAVALEAAEMICRKVRQKNLPWGGVRVIAVGDFAQLPPVSGNNRVKDWAFMGSTWSQSDFKPAVLKTVMRSEDEEYIRILNFVREGIVNAEVENFLNSRISEFYDHENVTHLFAKRDMTENYNLKCLHELEDELLTFATEYTGDSIARSIMRKNAPIPEILQLKNNALVMIRVNDPMYRFVNGTTGVIKSIHQDRLIIQLRNHREIELEKSTFSLLSADGMVIATATNFPVSLAYATTIHKSQGATLDQLVVDLKNLWEPGQAYVALSRLRRGADLTLTGWHSKSIFTAPEVNQFHRELIS